MKRHLICIVSALVVGGLAWVSFGQSRGAGSDRPGTATGERSSRATWRERRQKAISAIEEQLAETKSAIESSSARPANWRDLSEEERTKLRERFRKMREGCEEHRGPHPQDEMKVRPPDAMA